MPGTIQRIAIVAASILPLAGIVATAEARDVYDRGEQRFVVAESRFGHGTVSGPVRAAGRGLEVRMPGGTWIPCRRSCAETLRVETVDFWENQGRSRMDNEAGFFGPLTIYRRY